MRCLYWIANRQCALPADHEGPHYPVPPLTAEPTPLDQAVRILRALVGDGGAVRQSGPNTLDLDVDFDHLADVVHQARVFLYRVKGDL